MSESTYIETLGFFVNILKVTAASRKTISNGLLTVGTNSTAVVETQIAPNSTYSGPVPSTQVLAIICDGPLNITYSNGTQSFTTTVNSLAIIPGAITSYTLTNNGINAVNCRFITA